MNSATRMLPREAVNEVIGRLVWQEPERFGIRPPEPGCWRHAPGLGDVFDPNKVAEWPVKECRVRGNPDSYFIICDCQRRGLTLAQFDALTDGPVFARPRVQLAAHPFFVQKREVRYIGQCADCGTVWIGEP